VDAIDERSMKIELQEVCFRYSGLYADGSKPQLDNISLTIDSAGSLGIVGPGGAGKTTLLQLLTALEKPTSGNILVDGQNIHHKAFPIARLRRQIGLVFQFPEDQLFEMTVGEDIAFGPQNLELPEDEIRGRVEAAMRKMGLPPEKFFHRNIYHLSQGEKRRVAIAGILAMAPQILVLDEPTAGLDPQTTGELKHYLIDLHENHRHGLIVVSHDIDFLSQVVKRILVLENGQLCLDFKMNALEQMAEKLPADFPLPRYFRMVRHLRKLGVDIPAGISSELQLLTAIQKDVKFRECNDRKTCFNEDRDSKL
jgi:energy-coupling factor transport system ATP-binding protein